VLPGTSHYLLGRRPRDWHTHVPNYARVKFEGVYPGVDIVYHGKEDRLEYDFILAPGAHPNVIRLEFRGAGQLEIAATGDLLLRTGSAEVRHHCRLPTRRFTARREWCWSFVKRGGDRPA
jgi:hypothetical protein